jgi:hypothetical protein
MTSAATTRTAARRADAAACGHHVAAHDDLVRGHVWTGAGACGASISPARAPSYHTEGIIRSSHTLDTACTRIRPEGQP